VLLLMKGVGVERGCRAIISIDEGAYLHASIPIMVIADMTARRTTKTTRAWPVVGGQAAGYPRRLKVWTSFLPSVQSSPGHSAEPHDGRRDPAAGRDASARS
jgi:hypothetical protein